MKRSICGYWAWVWPLLVVVFTHTASSQIWKQLVPGSNATAAISNDYSLTQENGPWLIVAASFNGDGAQKQAGENRPHVVPAPIGLFGRYSAKAGSVATSCHFAPRPLEDTNRKAAPPLPARSCDL